MGVLINEFEISPPAEGEAGQPSAATASQPSANHEQRLDAADVHTLIERREDRLARLYAH